jgi:hypothetical protein
LPVQREAKRLEVPTVFAIVLLREIGPERRGGGGGVVAQRDRAFAANSGGRVAGELRHQRNHVVSALAGDA